MVMQISPDGTDIVDAPDVLPGIASIDEPRETSITVSCYRETHRLERVLQVFQRALTLARELSLDEWLLKSLVKLHDHKGALTATWVSADVPHTLRSFVEQAWTEANEWEVIHQDIRGDVFSHPTWSVE